PSGLIGDPVLCALRWGMHRPYVNKGSRCCQGPDSARSENEQIILAGQMIARRKRLPSRPDPACRCAVAAMRRATADLNDAHLEDWRSSRCWVRGTNLSPSLVIAS